jgi:hypothetical protein
VLKLQHGGHRLSAHVLDGVLVAEPVRALDGVVHVEAPIVAVAHVAERGRHTALRRHRVAARRENFCDAGGFQSGGRHAERGAQSRAPGTDNNDVIAMVDDLVGLSHRDVSGRPPTRQSVTGILSVVNENDLFSIHAETTRCHRQA